MGSQAQGGEAPRKPRLVLLGKQGAGKGTQATRVAQHYEIPHLSTGDMFRELAARGTAFGLEAKRYMDAGELVPDEIVVGVVEECLAPGGPLDDGFVLDGFPRTLHQATRARPRARCRTARRRRQHRRAARDRPRPARRAARVCENCQRVYHVNLPPTNDWTCDTCGGRVVQRDDDTEEAIDRRLELYERETVPIIDYYRESAHLQVVDGIGEGDEVFDRILKVVDEHLS